MAKKIYRPGEFGGELGPPMATIAGFAVHMRTRGVDETFEIHFVGLDEDGDIVAIASEFGGLRVKLQNLRTALAPITYGVGLYASTSDGLYNEITSREYRTVEEAIAQADSISKYELLAFFMCETLDEAQNLGAMACWRHSELHAALADNLEYQALVKQHCESFFQSHISALRLYFTNVLKRDPVDLAPAALRAAALAKAGILDEGSDS